jgi:uncharacterized membrane protein
MSRSRPVVEEDLTVAQSVEYRYSQAVYPVHAVFLAGTVPLFVGAALSDIAYASSYNIQWNNFASWLIAGGLIFAAVALVFAAVDVVRVYRRAPGVAWYAVILLVTWVIGFLNALVHARDAWASMPTGLILSVIVALLACVATWFGFWTPHTPRIGAMK